MNSAITFSKTPYAELHLHLGGALMPRILYHQVVEKEKSNYLRKSGYKNYNSFEAFFKKDRKDLQDYLEMHELVEPIQTIDRLDYFVKRLMRGAFEFEGLSYMELRYCPYSRTNRALKKEDRIKEMRKVIETIHNAFLNYSNGNSDEHYPIIMKQILCMHSNPNYTDDINAAIVDLAIEFKEKGVVCGIDIAGGEIHYEQRFDEIVNNFKKAKKNGLHTTAHLYETDFTGLEYSELLPHLDRIGHGIKMTKFAPHLLPEVKGKCLEICPTTYIKTGTFQHLTELVSVFELLEKYGVDATICTDNGGMHMVRLPNEYENLLIHNVITHEKLQEYRKNAFKHAFGLTKNEKKLFLADIDLKIKL